MENKKNLIAIAAIAAAALTSCRWIDPVSISDGYISTHFSDIEFRETRAVTDIPDTNDFILSITDASGKVLYDGPYGNSPEKLSVSAGTYTIKAVSGEFKSPSFGTPQYGDEQVVIVPAGGTVSVQLCCRQINCGIRLKTDPSFLTGYPKGVLYVQTDASHKLMYAYTEKRFAFFNPGNVSVVLSDSGKNTTLMTRNLLSQDMLTVSISAVSPSGQDNGGEISMDVDTTRTWTEEDYVIGGSDGSEKGASADNAFTIAQAKESIGRTGVWVCGYIVGGDLTSSATGMKTVPPFSSASNLAIASRSVSAEKSSCMSVQLPSGSLRDALNLVSHPENIGKRLYIKGDIVAAYFSIPGIKNPTDFVLK